MVTLQIFTFHTWVGMSPLSPRCAPKVTLYPGRHTRHFSIFISNDELSISRRSCLPSLTGGPTSVLSFIFQCSYQGVVCPRSLVNKLQSSYFILQGSSEAAVRPGRHTRYISLFTFHTLEFISGSCLPRLHILVFVFTFYSSVFIPNGCLL